MHISFEGRGSKILHRSIMTLYIKCWGLIFVITFSLCAESCLFSPICFMYGSNSSSKL